MAAGRPLISVSTQVTRENGTKVASAFALPALSLLSRVFRVLSLGSGAASLPLSELIGESGRWLAMASGRCRGSDP